jgi:hypothetical protein
LKRDVCLDVQTILCDALGVDLVRGEEGGRVDVGDE